MKEFKQKRRLEKIVFSRFTFLIIFALLVSLAFPVIKGYQKSKEATTKSDLAREEIDDLNTRKDKLEANINRLNTPFGIEEELRGKFQIKKPGEEFVVIVEEDTEVSVNTQDGEEDISLWNTIKNFFQSIF